MKTELSEQELQAARGTRDYSGSAKRARDYLLDELKAAFELYGFSPLETPAFENYSVLSAKFAGGEEILKETYRFKDQGGRELALRYDLTVPLCRFFAENQSIARPFKRYAIGSVWRDGPLKSGRYREFSQADVDTLGVVGMEAEAEILAMTAGMLTKLFGKNNFTIKVNNRKLLDGVLETAGVASEKREGALLALDKLEKIGGPAVREELVAKRGVSEKQAELLFELLSLESLEDLEAKVKSESGKQGAKELKQLFSLLESMGCADSVAFSPTLSRGLNYYTGTVFEAFLAPALVKKTDVSSSVAAGGRYDKLVGGFVKEATGRDESVPAVGISFGVDVLCDCIGADGAASAAGPKRAFVIPIKVEFAKVAPIVQSLRAAGVPTGVDLLGRAVGKGIEFASKQGFAFAVFIGTQELDAKKVKVRNLESGEEKLLSVKDAAELMKK